MTATPYVALSAAIYVNAYDLTSDSYMMVANVDASEADATNFGSGGKQQFAASGIVKAHADLSGFFDGTLNNPALWAYLNTAQNLVTLAPFGTRNDRAFMMRSVESKFSGPDLKIGDTAKLNGHVASDNVEGGLMGYLIEPSTTKTTTGVGTEQQDGAVLTGQFVHGFLHVFAESGTAAPTLAVTVKSAAATGMAGATTRLTFATQTGLGQDYQFLAGPITDTWWRVEWAITGTTPSFGFAVALAIQ